jgi:succinate dehydrogenase hydrophobic anchor subunit
MTDASAAAMAFFGFVAVLFPLFANEYSLGNRAGAKGNKIPKRFGQIWFLAFASIIFYLALHHFLAKH